MISKKFPREKLAASTPHLNRIVRDFRCDAPRWRANESNRLDVAEWMARYIRQVYIRTSVRKMAGDDAPVTEIENLEKNRDRGDYETSRQCFFHPVANEKYYACKITDEILFEGTNRTERR